jgi:hypothetical protein
MGRSSFDELTDKIARCMGVGKEPPNNGAFGIAPKRAALWPDAVPRVKFIYLVQPTYETAGRNDRIYEVFLNGLCAFIVGHLIPFSIAADSR